MRLVEAFNDMMQTRTLSRPGAHLVFVLGALLTVALATTVPQAKSSASQTKGTAPKAKVAPSKTTKIASKSHPAGSLNRDLLIHLDEGQKGLQRQLQTLTGTTQRRTDELNRRIDTLTDQLQRLASSQQRSSATQQLLTATIRSMHRLLIIIVGLLVGLCSALFFFVFQLKQIRAASLLKDKQIDPDIREAPDGAFDAHWKVGS